MEGVSLTVANATLIVDAEHDAVRDGWFVVRDGRIEDVGAGVPPRGGAVLDVGGAIVAPGFVSAHSHVFTSARRGLAPDSDLLAWTPVLCDALDGLDEESVYWHVLLGALGFLAAGITTTLDFSDASERHEVADGAFTGGSSLRPVAYQTRQIDAKGDSGIRFVNAVFLDDGFGDDAEILRRFGAAAEHASGVPNCLGSAVAGALQWSENPRAAILEREAMRRFGAGNQAHVLESPVDVAQQRRRMRPYLEPGMEEVVLAHFIHADAETLDRARGRKVAWQPVANGRLASGILPLDALRRAGVRVGMGMDDHACNDAVDPWQNMRTGLFLARASTSDPRTLSVIDALHMHTLGAADVIGVSDRVGSLEPGKFADFLVVDPEEPYLGPIDDPRAAYVLAAGQRNLKAVYIGGEAAARDGRPTAAGYADAVRRVRRDRRGAAG